MNNKSIFAVFGASGFGREVMPLVKAQYTYDGCDFCFIDDNPSTALLNGVDVFSYADFLNLDYENKFVTIAIADSAIRERLVQRVEQDNISFFDVKASNVVVMDDVVMGLGAILSPFVTLTSNIKIGSHFHANIYSYVAHDCHIGNYVTFAPNVHCNGNVIIENFAYIGTGAIIKQGTPSRPIVIGQGAIVGMGAVVTKSVKAYDVVFGVPARSLKKNKG